MIFFAIIFALAAAALMLSVSTANIITGGGCFPPAGATAVGFTTCALNANFSQSKYAVQVNYLTCQKSTDSGVATEWWQDAPNVATMPCDIGQAVDNGVNGDGSTVLRVTWKPGYTGGGLPSLQQIHTRTIFPPNSYVQIVARLQMTPDVTSDPWEDPSAYSIFWSFNNPGFEPDVNENFGPGSGVPPNNTGTNIHSWPNNFPNISPWSAHFDVRQYHKFGLRLTGDSVDGGTQAFCTDFDDVRGGCGTLPIQTGTVNNRYNWDITVGAICSFNFGDVSCQNPSLQRMDYFVKSVDIFTCSDWLTRICATGPITSIP